ncbi:MAG: TerC family protein [Anaerolineales bacterium]|nr:TerC family protein [Anaerolineales bacterium]
MELFTIENAIALLTLAVLEIVLGIDNIVFISILADRLPHLQRDKARRLGLGMALLTRLLLLLSLSWMIRLTKPIFTLWNFEVSGRDLILLGGGLFLLYKSTHEIHEKLEGKEGKKDSKSAATMTGIVIQIAILDIVFSLDSVITAVGMANELAVMIAAILIAMAVMLYASGPISDFVSRHPTLKILALSFLLLIGMSLIVEALHAHIPKGYIYFAMGFSVFVELLNLRLVARGEPVRLHQPYLPPSERTPNPLGLPPTRRRTSQ